jgi:hypothetical protein
VAVARPSCLYCGTAFSGETVAAAERSRAAVLAGEAAARPDRALLVVRLEGTAAGALAAALGTSGYEAAQWARRGGYHLHRVLPPGEARAERDRLSALGVAAFTFDEAGVRAAAEPAVAVGGSFDGGRLRVHVGEGTVEIGPGALLLVVKGPIAREHPAREDRLRFASLATLEPGYRFHLHLAAGGAPVELDPGGFDFGAERSRESSLLEIAGWVDRLAAGAVVDDAFRRVPPALAPAAPARAGLAGAGDALRRSAGRGDAVILDNLAQFRFYSAWRGAAERLQRR